MTKRQPWRELDSKGVMHNVTQDKSLQCWPKQFLAVASMRMSESNDGVKNMRNRSGLKIHAQSRKPRTRAFARGGSHLPHFRPHLSHRLSRVERKKKISRFIGPSEVEKELPVKPASLRYYYIQPHLGMTETEKCNALINSQRCTLFRCSASSKEGAVVFVDSGER